MSQDDIYNALCEIFFNEEVRLLNRISELETYIRCSGSDDTVMLELIRARARFTYFKSYMKDVLNYLKYFK